MKKADELVAEFNLRRQRDSKRLEEYSRMLAPYFGDEEGGPRGRVQANYADGRAALRYTPDGDDGKSSQHDVLNLIPQIVDSIVAVRGVNPVHSVKPENTDEAGLTQELKRTRALREQHEHSGMISQGAQLAFYLAGMGDGCFVLNPRLPSDVKADQKRDQFVNPFLPVGVYITVINPAAAFPKFRLGVPGNEIEDLFCYWDKDPDEIEAAYGHRPGGRTQLIHYYSRTEKRIIADGRDLIAPVSHDLGFCPAVWCFNKANDGRPAQSEIRMAIGMNNQLGLVYDIWLDSLIWAVHPIIHVHDREYVSTSSDAPEIGPGASVSTRNTGKVELLSPQGHPEVAEKMMETLVESLHQVTGVSPIQTQGIINKSNVSARSVSQQQSPMEQRLMLSNLLLSESYAQLNARILLMLTNLKAFKGVEFPMYGQDKRGTYNDSFTSDDIGGWVRTATKWDQTLGTSRHELLAMVLQVFKESVVTGQPYRYPFRLVLEAIGIEDPQSVMAEALSEAKAAADAAKSMAPQPPGGDQQQGDPSQMVQDASALQQGGQAAAAPPGGAGPVQPGMPAPPGGPNGAGPPNIPGFPPIPAAPSRQGVGNAAEVPDIGKMVSSAIGGLRLHGEILSVTGGTGNSIHIMVSDHRDIAQVRTAVEAVAGGMSVVVKVQPTGSKIPANSSNRSA